MSRNNQRRGVNMNQQRAEQLSKVEAVEPKVEAKAETKVEEKVEVKVETQETPKPAVSVASVKPLDANEAAPAPTATRVQPPPPAKRNVAAIGRLQASVPLTVEKLTDFQLELNKSLANQSELVRNFVKQLNDYVANMRPRMPIVPAVGVKNQELLHNAIAYVVKNASGEEFDKCWSILLGFFADGQELKNAFYRRYTFRFLDSEGWRMTDEYIRSFEYLLDMLHHTAAPETRRKHFENLDLDKTLKNFTEEERAKIVTFYSLK